MWLEPRDPGAEKEVVGGNQGGSGGPGLDSQCNAELLGALRRDCRDLAQFNRPPLAGVRRTGAEARVEGERAAGSCCSQPTEAGKSGEGGVETSAFPRGF